MGLVSAGELSGTVALGGRELCDEPQMEADEGEDGHELGA